MTRFAAPIADQIWDQKYRFKEFDGTPIDLTVEDTWRRIAKALAAAEKPEDQSHYEQQFYEALEDFKFLPAGRIISGAGTGRDVTFMNCYASETIGDSMVGIFDAVQHGAVTLQQGGGIGYDFSSIRPKGALVKGVGSDASGPLSFMDVFDSMCRTIMSAGARRGAQMGTMICDHPDIEDFIEAKRDPQRMRNFNLSVLVTDSFMEAVKNEEWWDLKFDGKVYKTISALALWNKIMRSTYDYAEPGVLFIDRINKMNPLCYTEEIRTTNPCGEVPLPPYGACLLGSINLPKMIECPFTDKVRVNKREIESLVRTAVRMMDNVIDITKFPLPQQDAEAKAKRRIGLGVTGLADALLMLGITYGSDDAVAFTDEVMSFIAREAYRESARLAQEKGAFPLFDRDAYLAHPYVQQFDKETRDSISAYGLRNSHLTSIAPTGTISLYAGNVSSGIEPVFAYKYTRKVLEKDGSKREEQVEDYAYAMYRRLHPDLGEMLPDYFVSAQTLDPIAHVRMQAAAQKWVDAAISKTINCPEDISFEDFVSVYEMAYKMGCKGCTTYRPNDVTGSVLSVEPPPEKTPEPELCEDEGCDHHGTPHVCNNITQAPLASRAEALNGRTYKLKWPGSEHAIYVTINDDETGNPFEIFINSKDTEHFSWTVALTRMISAVFRRGGDVHFVADELKAVFDPRGGAWMEGKYIPSVLAAIGGVIERHMDNKMQSFHVGGVVRAYESPKPMGASPADMIRPTTKPCPKCGSYHTKNESGCFQCLECGESKCG